ncbi:50S ribosomal subunit L30 [Verticillium alfalfae VaMs.102]|uniref:50S ribosomal subunit L30 n=1 Tax=Verticillium alfalfae (strain VaMs.102 / ATCC MYA-4576 / FGSC 10136) TaxID=526221 RepID=C9SVH6_VERA1|nr:50S ribosomal subunit L30 [Verticillium alfalfae VaMs.102]EEY22791.1 50S ribosomal subunit L30 [Verticillium alfalfae VaMs.102]
MAASSRGALAIRGLLRTSSPRLCRQCATTGLQIRAPNPWRAYSGAAGRRPRRQQRPIDLPPTTTRTPSEPANTPAAAWKSHYRIQARIILTRAPLLTAEETAFESAFYFYQKRLNERLSMPFVTSVYFKPDTPALIDWNLKVRDREGHRRQGARRLPRQVGARLGRRARRRRPAELPRRRLRRPAPRRHDARQRRRRDHPRRGARRRLRRPRAASTKANRTGNVGGPRPPPSTGRCTFVRQGQGRATAKRVMDKTAGLDMNTWMVGRVPVAHHVVRPALGEDGSLQKRGEKTFFLKARIMAGQANLEGNPFGYTEFKWLTAEELKASVDEKYYHSVRNMLADR